MLSNYYEDTGVMLDYIQNATLYNCKLDYCFLENLFINNSPIGLNAPNEAIFTNVTINNNLLVTSGNVGIGVVADPLYKLDVFGSINFTGELFKNGVPVYTGGGGTGGNGSTSVFLTRSAQAIGTQTITSGLNILKFPDNELSSGHVVYNSTTGAFYVTLEGLYSIFVDVDFYNADKAVDLYILKNGSETSGEGRIAWVNCPANDATTINANLYLEAGDYITVNIYNYSANSFTTPYANNKVNSFAMALFNSSQWQGDAGNPISYTAASVTMLDTITTNLMATNLTVNDVVVTVGNVGIGGIADPKYKLDVFGDINLTGDIYKDDILYLPTPVYLTRSAQTKDYQTIIPGVNVLKFPDAGYSNSSGGSISYNASNGRFSVNQAGLYSIFVDVDFYNADKSVDVYILKNNIEDSINGRIAWINCPANDATSINAMVYLEETDYITVIVKNNSSNNFTTPYDNNKVNSFAMSLMNSSSSPRASQWIGDIGSTISYTSGTVSVTNSVLSNITASNILIANATVTGTILILGNSLKAVSNSNTVGNIFTTGGNVGIGIVNPSSKLHVEETTAGYNYPLTRFVRDLNTSDASASQHGYQLEIGKRTDNKRMALGVMDNGVCVIQGKELNVGYLNLSLNPIAANVGIGTTSPSYKLEVNGGLYSTNITTTKLVINTGNITNESLLLTNVINSGVISFGDEHHQINSGHYDRMELREYGSIGFWTGGLLTNQTLRMFISSSGNVGIGTTSPSARLQINAPVDNLYGIDSGAVRIFGTAFTSGHNGTLVVNSTNNYARNVGASIALGGRMFNFGSGNQHATFAKISGVQANNVDSYNGNFVIETLDGSGSLGERLRITQDGNVGIGTANPSNGKFEVSGSVTRFITARFYNSSGVDGTVTTDRPLSIYTSDHIACAELQVFSDERIKTNIIDVQDDSALNIIRNIQPKRYNYVDTVYNTTQPVYGFIAQQVKQVMDYSVSEIIKYIPNIFSKATITTSSSGTLVNFLNDVTDRIEIVEPGKDVKIKIYGVNDKEYIVKLNNIIDARTFSIEEEIPENDVFVYGQEVDNFHILNKSAIFTVSVAALQEVDRQLQEEKQKHDITKQELAALKTFLQSKYPGEI